MQSSPFDNNVHIYSVICPANRSEPALTKTAGEEMSSFHLHHRIAPHRTGKDLARARGPSPSRGTGNAPAVPVGGAQHRLMACPTEVLAVWETTHESNSPPSLGLRRDRQIDRASRTLIVLENGARASSRRVSIAPRRPSVSSYRYKVASATAITAFRHPWARAS